MTRRLRTATKRQRKLTDDTAANLDRLRVRFGRLQRCREPTHSTDAQHQLLLPEKSEPSRGRSQWGPQSLLLQADLEMNYIIYTARTPVQPLLMKYKAIIWSC